jgi:hypothetical protein
VAIRLALLISTSLSTDSPEFAWFPGGGSMKYRYLLICLAGLVQACSPSYRANSDLSQNGTIDQLSRGIEAQSVDASTQSATNRSQSCEEVVTELGSNYLSTFNLSTEYTRTGMKLRFIGRTHTRIEANYSVQFNPVAYGFSIKFRNGNSEIAVPESAFIAVPIGNSKFSQAALIASGSSSRAQLNFHIARMAEVDNINYGIAQLYCHNRLVGSAAHYFPNPTHVDACKRDGGAVIDGACHFNSSCVSRDVAGTRIYNAAASGYTSCFNAVPTVHPDCVAGYHASLGYLASCPLINEQESSDSSSSTTMQKINLFYREHRARNPDQGGLQFWRAEIERDPAQLQVLETMLRQ